MGRGLLRLSLSSGGGPPAAGAGTLPEEPLRGLSEPGIPAGGGTANKMTLAWPPDLSPLTPTASQHSLRASTSALDPQ